MLRDPGTPNRVRQRALHDGFVNVISRGRTELRIAADPRRWKHTLPPPVDGRVHVLAPNRERQDDPAEPVCQIVVMLAPDDLQMRRQWHLRGSRQHGHAILLPLALSNHDFAAIKVDVLDAQLEAFP